MADLEFLYPELSKLFEHSDDEFDNFFFEADDELNFQQPSLNKVISQRYPAPQITGLVFDNIDQKSKCSKIQQEEEKNSLSIHDNRTGKDYEIRVKDGYIDCKDLADIKDT